MSEQLQAVREVLDAAEEDPESVDVEDALPYVDATGATERVMALRAIGAIAADRPEEVLEHVEELRPLLDDDVIAPRTLATFVFGFLAEESPESVIPSVPRLVELLEQDPPLLRFRAARTLVPLLAEHSEEFVPHLDDLVDVLVDGPEMVIPDPTDPELPDEMREEVRNLLDSRSEEFQQDKARSQGVFEFAANAIVEVAELEPETVAPHVPAIAERADADRALVRAAVLDTIAVVGQHDPEAAAQATDQLLDRLDDEHEYLRAHAVRALGYAEATEAVDDLRELAEEDVEDELQELAADTADWLEEQAEE